jgi:hypothetical protein
MSHLQKELLSREKNVKNYPPICPNALYENLKMSVAKRLLHDEEADLPKWA